MGYEKRVMSDEKRVMSKELSYWVVIAPETYFSLLVTHFS